MNRLFLYLAISLVQATGEDGGLFTSSADLEGLLWTEAEVVRKLENYIQDEYKRIHKLDQMLIDYRSIRDRASESSEQFVGNPLNSFLLIKKLTTDWKALEVLVQCQHGESLLMNLTREQEHQTLRWPNDEDLNGAAIGLMRLQDTYRLDPSSLAKGVINGRYYGPHLTAQDCFELGRQTITKEDYYHTNIWMEEALRQYDKETDKTVEKTAILDYLTYSVYMSGNIRRALKLTREILRLNPEHPRGLAGLVYYEYTLNKNGATMEQRGEDGLGDAEETVNILKEQRKREEKLDTNLAHYEQLCRGEEFVPEYIRSKLLCRYTSGSHPYLIIGPVKEEEVYPDPRIVVFHDLVTDAEIDTCTKLARPKFKRPLVTNPTTGAEEHMVDYRTAKTAWLQEYEHPHIASIYRKAGQLTGLNMETSEDLQVCNYGIGGHYEPHFDFSPSKIDYAALGTGNRIATLLIYNSNVEQGGATAFPHLGISLKPRKGSVAFWYNLRANGEGDERTLHAACPVLTGTKWVSNFWIHEQGQEFTRPCSIDPLL